MILALALCALGAAQQACAHRGYAVRHKTVSAVTNHDVTGDPDDPDHKVMKFTVVSPQDALKQDRATVEHEAMYGHLNRGNAPVPALQNERAKGGTEAHARAEPEQRQ